MGLSSETTTPMNASRHDAADTHLHGSLLLVARIVWGVVVFIDLAVFVIGFPIYANKLRTICTDPTGNSCNLGQLNPMRWLALQHVGWSLERYMFYVLALCVATTLLYVVVGALIFWHKSAERMGLHYLDCSKP
jgi:hypothetical protein